MNSFYLAGPFFNPEQISVLEDIEERADELGMECFSPRVECFCPPQASVEQRLRSFEGNCKGILSHEFVLARIDDFDPGTVWELGFTHGYNKGFQRQADGIIKRIKVYAFTTVPSRGLNLMLAQSVDGFLQGMPSVLKFLEEIRADNEQEALQWKGNVI
jgi:nucleoside 2-deoxyribosyltransferase